MVHDHLLMDGMNLRMQHFYYQCRSRDCLFLAVVLSVKDMHTIALVCVYQLYAYVCDLCIYMVTSQFMPSQINIDLCCLPDFEAS